MRFSRMFVGLLSCAWIFLVACPKQPVRIQMVVRAATNVNPDDQGRPLSVAVRIYQLKDRGRLDVADYDSLIRSESSISEDVVYRQERTFQPGDQETIEVHAAPMAAYVGIVAFLRNPSGDGWRRIVPVSGKTLKVAVTLGERSIDVTTSQK